MPRYVIERDFPGAGRLSADDLQAVSKKSCDILEAMGPGIQWDHTYVANDKLYCVYVAQNEELLREHARRGEFPITKISRVETVIDPVTSEARTTASVPMEMAV
jgi:hypothetical protein